MRVVNENWALLCEIGFWGWTLSVIGLLIQTFTQNTVINKISTTLWGFVSVVFYFFWIYGMVSA
jgi:hypothetical protein